MAKQKSKKQSEQSKTKEQFIKFSPDFVIGKSEKLYARKLALKKMFKSRKIYLGAFQSYKDWKVSLLKGKSDE